MGDKRTLNVQLTEKESRGNCGGKTYILVGGGEGIDDHVREGRRERNVQGGGKNVSGVDNGERNTTNPRWENNNNIPGPREKTA